MFVMNATGHLAMLPALRVPAGLVPVYDSGDGTSALGAFDHDVGEAEIRMSEAYLIVVAEKLSIRGPVLPLRQRTVR